ncbi:DNase I-like protein [Epithele typhae]|uniref:DNase I-like protein n=1 Tax=Epithele typhae TaxID=378194 RepID=UPI0020077AB7|nr:DNase I-like protein [Epithele typhae]KAH9921725.1 DNase I-like protein [Epithele typhae]
MRILSWNINGIRTLPQYHPWNTFKSCDGILEELKADIICFQEMKSSRATLPRDVGVPDPYHALLSFPTNKGGYSGVAVYTDSRKVVPLKAEEGLSGRLQPKPPLSEEERISPSYPYPHSMDLFADENGGVPSSFDNLDSEGRGLVVDFGLFVLINVYCPNETSDARLSFKMNYHLLLQERVRKLVEEEHREVIVLGDINSCAAPIDSAEGQLPSVSENFYVHPARAWFHKWLSPNGPMTDIIRELHPTRKGMYTCWNNKLQGRETNYGARIDYILVTKGLLPWISGGDIQPSLKGSDHCPIYIDLHEQITLDSGEVLTLRDAMKQHADLKEPPRLVAKFWPEFAGKQTVLSAFFGKQVVSTTAKTDPSPTPPLSQSPSSSQTPAPTASSASPTPAPAPAPALRTQPAEPPAKKFKPSQTTRAISAPSVSKRKPAALAASSSAPTKKRKQGMGQASLASFFAKPPASSSKHSPSQSQSHSQPEVIQVDDSDDDRPASSQPQLPPADDDTDQLDADRRLACELAADSSPSSQSSSQTPGAGADKDAWSALFAKVPPPLCTVHHEPARLWTVNKQGPNKGKRFYLCARPVGPGFDKGRGERLREEVDPQYRCSYFKWASEVRREALKEKGTGKGKG